jgi:hypothetical protein
VVIIGVTRVSLDRGDSVRGREFHTLTGSTVLNLMWHTRDSKLVRCGW